MKTLILILSILFSLNIQASEHPTDLSLWGSVPPSAAKPGDQIHFLAMATGGSNLEYMFDYSVDGAARQILKPWGPDNNAIGSLPTSFTSVEFYVTARGVGLPGGIYTTQIYGYLKDITISDSTIFAGDVLSIFHPSFQIGQSYNGNFTTASGYSRVASGSVVIQGRVDVVVPNYVDPVTGLTSEGSVSVFVSGLPTRSRPVLKILDKNLYPVINLTFAPESGTAPLNVNFDATSSYLPGYQSANDHGIASCTWEFPDGKTTSKTINGCQITHEFMSGGAKEVNLIVTGVNGKQRTAQRFVQVIIAGSGIIGVKGGIVTLENIATVTIPPGAFPNNTLITVEADYTSSKNDLEFEGSSFGMIDMSPYIVKISSTQNISRNKKLKIEMIVPDKFKISDESVGVLAKENVDDDEGSIVDSFYRHIKDVSKVGNSYSFFIGPVHFFNNTARIVNYKFLFNDGIILKPYGKCFGVGFNRPYSENRVINAKFNEPRDFDPVTNSFKRMHAGIDIKAVRGTPIYSPGATVVRRYVNCPRNDIDANYYVYFVPPSGSNLPGPQQQRNSICPTSFNTQTDKWSGYNGYGEVLEIRPYGTNQILKFTHLSDSSNFYNENDDLPKGVIIGYSDNTGSGKIAPHMHIEMITADTYEGQYPVTNPSAERGTVDPLSCMLNPNIRDLEPITGTNSPTSVLVQTGDDIVPVPGEPENQSRFYANGGASRIFRWNTPEGLKTSCASSIDFRVFTGGFKTIGLEVTDYWGNTESDSMTFEMTILSSGDKNNHIQVPYRSLIGPADSTQNSPFAFFSTSQVNAYSSVVFDASLSLAGTGIVHTYKWYFGSQLMLETCIPKAEIRFPDFECQSVKLSIEDSGRSIAETSPQIVCPLSGDK